MDVIESITFDTTVKRAKWYPFILPRQINVIPIRSH